MFVPTQKVAEVCFLSSFQKLPGDAQVRSECCLISANAEGSSITFIWSLAVHAHSILLLIQLHMLYIVWANHACSCISCVG